MRLLLLLVLLGCRDPEPRPSARPERAPEGGESKGAPAPRSDLTDVTTLIPDAIVDLRYATADNFTGAVIYPSGARCLLAPRVAEQLAAAAAELRDQGYRLVLWDCYRPHSAQKLLWSHVPDPRYVAEPEDDAGGRPLSGSIHSRAAAVDVGLADADGTPLEMPTAHDHFGPEAHRDHRLTGDVRDRMRALDRAMTGAGFEGLPTEWWHYAAADAARYPLRDQPID